MALLFIYEIFVLQLNISISIVFDLVMYMKNVIVSLI